MKFVKWIGAAVLSFGSIAATTPAIAESASYQAESIQWHTDFEAAARTAKAESKPMFILFTGHGWCKACDNLKAEVLDNPRFIETMGDKYVFVEVDMPFKGKLTAEQTALKQRFSVTGYPSVVILDADQNQVGQKVVGYRGGTMPDYVAQLDRLSL
jgi:thioredoxin-related protein